ncbi:MAG: TonB-dependent receptor [Bacteroidetes bacterium]|nr:TonB-dependent receptor [Bacteroidota bacterium]
MKKRLLFLLLAGFFTGTSLFAQNHGSISGSVVDKETKEPLIGVNIVLKGTYYGAATDIDGNYKIENVGPGEYNIQASYVGYQKVLQTGIKVLAGKDTKVKFALPVEMLSLDQEVLVIGEKPIFDIEQANSAVQVKAEDLTATPLQNIQQVAGNQAGIVQTVDGIYVRGGKPYETGYYVDGVSAKDPLAGTGFGLELNLDDIDAVDVVTGGIGAESGATSGFISVKTKEGGKEHKMKVNHQRDYFTDGETDRKWSWNYDSWDGTISGPLSPVTGLAGLFGKDLGEVTYYTNFSYSGSDEFTKKPASQLYSSLFDNNTSLAPKEDNRWSGAFKITWKPEPTQKWFYSYRRSVNINQNSNMLKFVSLTGDLRPGYQYAFALIPDKATTYTSDLNQIILGYTQTLSSNDYLDFRVARVFSKLRADANGRPWRPDSLSEDYNPESIITDPISYWGGSTGDVRYVVQGNPKESGLYNKGISTTWHDHWAEEYTFKTDYTWQDQRVTFQTGFEHLLSTYQWVDIQSPWIGAPIRPGDATTQLGYAHEIWKVSPFNGGVYASYKIAEKGFIGSIGLRMSYFYPGDFADKLINNDKGTFPINPSFVNKYKKETVSLGGSNYWLRALPKVKVSFPVSDNQMLFFNYGHSISWPQAYQLYSKIDETDVSRLRGERRGNPTLKPETTVEYELGIRNQITANDALTVVAFTKDKFDYITTTGEQEIQHKNQYYYTYKNDDYAKILGIEVTYLTRITKELKVNSSVSYQQASAKSSDFSEFTSRKQDAITTKETFLPWDRPWMFKVGLTYTSPSEIDNWYGALLENWNINLTSNLQSGKRYDKLTADGIDNTTGLMNYTTLPTDRYSKLGDWWFWADLGARRNVNFQNFKMVISLKVTNLFDNKNSTVINPLTGSAYESGDPYPSYDPLNPHPLYTNVNPFNPARYLPQRHIVFGVSVEL